MPTLRITSLFLLLLILVFPAMAQDIELKWGEVPRADLEMTSFEEDSSAQAVILGEIGDVEVDVRGNVKFNYHIRVKLLSEAAIKDWGTYSIPYMDGEVTQRISKVQGHTFVLDDRGKVVKHKLGKKEIIDEEISDKWGRIRFTLPALEPGAVVEYKYTMTTSSPVLLPDWDFQHAEPTRWSVYKATIPHNLGYVMVYQVPYFFVEEKEEILWPEGKATQYLWGVKNLPALREEPFITTLEDYRARIELQLSDYMFPGSYPQKYLSTWDELAEKLRLVNEFGGALSGTRKIRNRAETLTQGIEDPHEKLRVIHEYVRTNIRWDGTYRYTISNRLDKIVEEGTGSVADQTIILIAMLRSVGIEADPVLLSTRSHGKVTLLHPLLSQFNYLIAHVNIRGKKYLVDCTDPLAPVELLPLRAISGSGWLIGDKSSTWIPLQSSSKYVNVTTFKGAIDENGRLTGNVSASSDGYGALSIRTAISEEGDENIVTNQVIDRFRSVHFDSVEIQNMDDLDKAVIISANIALDGFGRVDEDVLYVNPHALKSWNKNPLSLEERTFPVDLGYPREFVYSFQINIPEGYDVQEALADVQVNLPNKGGMFTRKTTVNNGMLIMQTRFLLNKDVYPPGEYAKLRELFERVIASQAEQIVLAKTEQTALN